MPKLDSAVQKQLLAWHKAAKERLADAEMFENLCRKMLIGRYPISVMVEISPRNSSVGTESMVFRGPTLKEVMIQAETVFYYRHHSLEGFTWTTSIVAKLPSGRTVIQAMDPEVLADLVPTDSF